MVVRQLLIIPILPPGLKELVLKCVNQMLQFLLSTWEDKRGLPFERGTQWNIYDKTLIIESFFHLHLAVFIYRQASLDYQKTRALFVFLHPIRSENAPWSNNNKKIVYSVYFSSFSVIINKLLRHFLMANLVQFDQNHKIFFLKSTELYVEFKYSIPCIFIILNLRLPLKTMVLNCV